MTNRFQLDAGSKFFRIQMSEADQQQALVVSPLFLALLQNKIEAYASALVETSLTYDPDPAKQVKAIIEHEKLRNYVAAYEELFAELTDQPQANSEN